MAKHTLLTRIHQSSIIIIVLSVPIKGNFQALQGEIHVIITIIIVRGTLLNQCIIRHCLVDNNTTTESICITIATINKHFDVGSNFIVCQSELVQRFVSIVNHIFFHVFRHSCANNTSLEIFHVEYRSVVRI